MATQQVIRHRCKTEAEFRAIAEGRLTYAIRKEVDVEPDDLITFVHVDASGQEHVAHRRVASVANTKELEIPDDELVRYGLTLASLVQPEFGALEPLLATNRFIIGFALIKKDPHGPHLFGDPSYMPPAASPTIDPGFLLQELGVNSWPDGLFSCMVLGREDRSVPGHPVADLTELVVMVRTRNEDDVDVFVRVNDMLLRTGSLQDLYARPVVPHFGEEENVFDSPPAGGGYDPESEEDMFEWAAAQADAAVLQGLSPDADAILRQFEAEMELNDGPDDGTDDPSSMDYAPEVDDR